ncbi:MAG: YbbR-like domain-containing protein [Flavobacteriaceae bacterium]|nr:YbbR-like domain-containing protein [Flavobacteriaceae bacterium]
MKNLIASFFTSKRINVFLLFFSLALLFSILSKLSTDYTKTLTYKLKPVNVPEEEVIIPDSLHKLDITVETYGFKFISYYFKNPELKVDFNNLQKDKNAYLWIERKQLSSIVDQFDSKIKIKAINPDTIFFRYDVNAIKKVPVYLKETIDFASGFDVTNGFKIEPDSIKLIGAKQILDTIHEVFTKPFNLNNVNKPISETIDLDMPESFEVLKLSDKKVKVAAHVEKFTEGYLDVPVIIMNVPEDTRVNFYPKTVTILFYTSLSNYKTIEESQFTIECDFKDISENNSFLTPKIVKQPKNLKNLRLETNKIEFILSQ